MLTSGTILVIPKPHSLRYCNTSTVDNDSRSVFVIIVDSLRLNLDHNRVLVRLCNKFGNLIPELSGEFWVRLEEGTYEIVNLTPQKETLTKSKKKISKNRYLITSTLLLLCANLSAATKQDLFDRYSQEYSLPKGLLSAICWVESKHKQPRIDVLDGTTPSHGICQIKEATARYMGFKGTVAQLRQPKYNIQYAAKYLAYQLNRYKGDTRKAIIAYNLGHYKKLIYNKYIFRVLLALWEGK